MKNLFKKITNKEQGMDETEIFHFGKKVFSEINPEKELLSKILDKVETQNVTNIKAIRNTITEEDGRGFKINPFSSFINNMNKNIKMFSGAVVAVAIVLMVFVFSNKNDTAMKPIVSDNISTSKINDVSEKSSVAVVVGGESIDTDLLVADLLAADKDSTEPMIDDSDLLLSLINTNDYEIQ